MNAPSANVSYVIAMTYHALQNQDLAKNFLQQADELAEQELSGMQRQLDWEERLHLLHWQREAHAMVDSN